MIEFTASVTPAEHRRLSEFINALRTPCKVQMNPDSPLNSTEFESEFRSKLLTHHCFMGSPLFQESFDSAFISACSPDGPTINIPIGQDPPDFTLKLDRSDAKITLANINKNLCLVHGSWEL